MNEDRPRIDDEAQALAAALGWEGEVFYLSCEQENRLREVPGFIPESQYGNQAIFSGEIGSYRGARYVRGG
jgi:N4-gp56 family major capsid protein